MIVGASRDESVDVVCEVESDPPAKVNIHQSVTDFDSCLTMTMLFDRLRLCSLKL